MENLNDRQPQGREVVRIMEALLFASDSPLPVDKIQAVIKDATLDHIEQAIDSLNEKYRAGGHSFAIKKIARGYQMYTLPDFAPWVRALFSHHRRERLSQQSLEVLAIVAYKQPIVKSDIGRLRGVNSEGPILTLLDRKLITIVGRKPTPGRPLLYATTQEFLTHFGLRDLDDLPKMEELEILLKRKEQAPLTEVMFAKIEEGEAKEPEKAVEEEKVIEEVPLPTIPKNPPESSAEDET